MSSHSRRVGQAKRRPTVHSMVGRRFAWPTLQNLLIAGTTLVLAAGTPPAWAQEKPASKVVAEFERLAQEQIVANRDAIRTLASIQDEATARAVVGQLKEYFRRVTRLKKDSRQVASRATSRDRQEIHKLMKEKYGPQIRDSAQRTQQEFLRVSRLPDQQQIGTLFERELGDDVKALLGSEPGGTDVGGVGAPASSPPEKGTWAFLFPLLMLAIVVACVATLYTEGMWSNAVRLVNVVFAALLATNFWEPLARYAEEQAPTFTYFWDFLCLWGLFGVFLIIFRAGTDLISRVKVRFLKIADRIGSAVLAALIGWVMVCFTMFTLHTAPLAEYFMFGAFRPNEANFLSMAPDLQWAGFAKRMSRGLFSRGLAEDEIARYGTTDNERARQTAVFNRNDDFVPKYAARRRMLEAYIRDKGTSRIAESDVIER